MRRQQTELMWILVSISLLIAAIVFVYLSPVFEREAPTTDLNTTLYWNFKTPLKIKISDNDALGKYKVVVEEKGKKTVLAEGVAAKGQKELSLTATYPKNAFLPTSSDAKLTIEATDKSLWNFFGPNKLTAEVKVICDIVPPIASIVSSSYGIAKGGSAVVVFEARDENLKNAFVKTTAGRVFKAQQFVKKGFYIALVAWELKDDNFAPSVVVEDMAGNEAILPINFFQKNVVYKDTKLVLKDDFLNQKIVELSSAMKVTDKTTPLDRFAFVNNTLRGENEKLISKVTTRVGDNKVDSFFTEPFLPIKNASVVGSFGDHRSFYMGNDIVSESYHKGVDFASTKEAVIVAPNNGVVIFNGANGIYGNMSILYHGLGLFTLYGHCSSFLAKEGDLVSKNQPIAKTGMSGLAFGDHLHYGVLIQGVEVRPLEWFDANWIKLNVTKVIDEAKNIIASRK
jgi:murein DD-endopeptidase MepM/ murein hydrolase activator NlpD